MKPALMCVDDAAPLSHPARGAWIETKTARSKRGVRMSHPARGAWIETKDIAHVYVLDGVAPREGCVD